ncbi:MAG: copper chaperone PCu(A)C [Burkholderiaceae bacterium]
MTARRMCLAAGLALSTAWVLPAHAHGVKAGDLAIDHPYATPSRPGMTTGAVYFRAIKNNGTEPDRLLSARTPAAATVELHRMEMEGDVMRMRAVPAVDLPANTEVRLRHGTPNGHHLMLLGLKAPLKDGDRFPVTLTFQRAGEREVMVWVQTPRNSKKEAEHAH